MTEHNKYIKYLRDSLHSYQQQDDMFLKYYAGSIKISSLSADFMMIMATNRDDERKFEKAKEMVEKLDDVHQAYESMLSRYEFAMNSYKAIRRRCEEMLSYIEKNEAEKELLKQMEKDDKQN